MEKGILAAQVGELRGRRLETRFGQICAAAVAIVGLSWSGHVSLGGHPVAGSALGGGTLATIVTAFLYRRNEQAKADASHAPPDPDRDLTRPDPPTLDSMARPEGGGSN